MLVRRPSAIVTGMVKDAPAAGVSQGTRGHINEAVLLTTMSVLAVLFLTFHITDDIVRGFEPGGTKTYNAILIAVVWLYATLLLAERRLGYVILLVLSLLGSGVPWLHMRGAGLVGGRIANSGGKFFWVFTFFAIGVTSIMTGILAARGLWRLQRARRL